MSRAAWIALALVTACSSSPKKETGPAVSAVDKKAACDAGDMASCVETARAACAGEAWQVEFDRTPSFYVTDNGLARLDRLNMVLLSTNAAEWLACIEECPGTAASKVCIPFVLDMRVPVESRTGCKVSDRDVTPWNGRAAKTRLRDCPGEIAEITYVPELANVQQALVAAKAFESGGPLDISGLVVRLTVDGTPIMAIDQVGEANCNVFDVPDGYSLVRGAEPFEKARAMQPRLQAAFDEAQAELRRELEAALRSARARVEPEVRRLCGDAGYKVDDEQSLGLCTYELEAARALITKAISEEMERARLAAEPKVDAALREHVIEPLCREFAPAGEATKTAR
jgi:hypothetical protein